MRIDRLPSPFHICFRHDDRTATIARTTDGWALDGNAMAERAALCQALCAKLAAQSAYGLVIGFDGPGIAGRVRDAGGARPSYVIDVDTMDGWSSGSSATTLAEAFGALLNELEMDDAPDSAS